MTITYRAAEIPASELTEKALALPTAAPLSGDITVRGHAFYKDEERNITSGTWECEPGASRWEFETRGEIIHVLSGRMTVQRDGEEAVELSAGSGAVFPIGWCGVWTVHETLRKVYVIYSA